MSKKILATASILLATAVALGAFGAHALKTHVSAEMLQIWKTGVEYQFYHSLGLLLIGILAIRVDSVYLKWSAILLFTGIIFFSGSLYLLTLTEIKTFGAITPIGGVCFISGWIQLYFGTRKMLTI